MAVSYIVENLIAPIKKLHIRLKPNKDIVVRMYGFNSTATDKVVSNCGRKPIVIEPEGFELIDLQLGGGTDHKSV